MKTMFLKQFSVQCRIIATIIALFLAVNSQAMATESGLLMGGLYAIGNDGAAEAGENPAYMAFATLKAKHSAHARSTAYRAGNIAVSALPITDATQIMSAMDFAFGWYRIAGSKWSAGLSVGDVRAPVYQRLALEGSQTSAATGLNVSIKTLNFDQLHGLTGALAFHLTAKESLGLRMRYSHRYVREKENLIAPQNTTITFSSELVTEQRAHQLHGTLSYLYHAADGDFTLMAGNVGVQQGNGSFAYSTVISTGANAVAAATQDASAYATQTSLDPFFLIGGRRRILGILNVFAEAGAQPTITQKTSDNFYRKDGSQKATVRRDIGREGEIALALGTGLGVNLSETVTWHSGVRYQTSKTRLSMVAEDNHSRYLENSSVQFLQASTGVSWRRLAYTWQLGVSYQYQNVALEKSSSYTDTGGDKTSQSAVTIDVNTYGVFFAVAADF